MRCNEDMLKISFLYHKVKYFLSIPLHYYEYIDNKDISIMCILNDRFCLSCFKKSNNFTINYTDIAAISPCFVCGGAVIAVDQINMKMTTGEITEIKASFQPFYRIREINSTKNCTFQAT